MALLATTTTTLTVTDEAASAVAETKLLDLENGAARAVEAEGIAYVPDATVVAVGATKVIAVSSGLLGDIRGQKKVVRRGKVSLVDPLAPLVLNDSALLSCIDLLRNGAGNSEVFLRAISIVSINGRSTIAAKHDVVRVCPPPHQSNAPFQQSNVCVCVDVDVRCIAGSWHMRPSS
jgi:hypothetical protein